MKRTKAALIAATAAAMAMSALPTYASAGEACRAEDQGIVTPTGDTVADPTIVSSPGHVIVPPVSVDSPVPAGPRKVKISGTSERVPERIYVDIRAVDISDPTGQIQANVWIYREANGIEGLQAGGSGVLTEDYCTSQLPPDQLIF